MKKDEKLVRLETRVPKAWAAQIDKMANARMVSRAVVLRDLVRGAIEK